MQPFTPIIMIIMVWNRAAISTQCCGVLIRCFASYRVFGPDSRWPIELCLIAWLSFLYNKAHCYHTSLCETVLLHDLFLVACSFCLGYWTNLLSNLKVETNLVNSLFEHLLNSLSRQVERPHRCTVNFKTHLDTVTFREYIADDGDYLPSSVIPCLQHLIKHVWASDIVIIVTRPIYHVYKFVDVI